MSKPRVVRPAKQGELRAEWGRLPGDTRPDICYAWGDGASKRDSALLHSVLNNSTSLRDKSFLQELESRGYDLTTLKFSIRKKAGGSDE